MPIEADKIWAAQPTTNRGQPTALSADPKGERIAYASGKSIFLRSIDNPAESTQYTAHTSPTTVARFSPSGYYVASGDATGMVRVWDCTGPGTTKGEYPIISGRINDLAWDGDSQRIIAVGDGKEKFGHAITADSGNTVGVISGHTAQINCVSIRQQRPIRAATAGDDMGTVFYQGPPFKFSTSFKNHQRYVYGLAFSPGGDSFVTVGADRRIVLYDGKTGEKKDEAADAHTGSIFGVSWSKDSRQFATCSADQTVKTWDAESLKSVKTWRLGSEGVVSVADHQVGVVWARQDLIISLALSGDLTYFSPSSSSPVRVVRGHQKNVTATTAVGKTLFTGSSDGQVRAWNTATGLASKIDGSGHTNYISGLSSTASQVHSVGWDDTLRTIDIASSTFTGTHFQTSGQPRGVTDSKDTAVATHKGVTVLKDGEVVKQLNTSFAATAIASTDFWIAVAADDEKLRLYSPTLELKSTITAAGVSCLSSPSPTSTLLAVGFASGKILVYDTKDFAEPVVTRWSSHTGRVTSIAWDSDAKRAVSSSLDTNIFVWSMEKPGQRVNVANAHKEGVNGVIWEDDRLISVGGDGCVKTWKVT